MRESNDSRILRISVRVSAAFLDFHLIDLLPPASGSDEWTLTVGSTDYIGLPGYAIGGESGAQTFPSRMSKLTASRVEPILHAITGLVIPACRPFTLGFDGDTFTLKLDCGLNHAEYNWWCEVPDAWKPLGRVDKIEGF